jgi:N4-gp56 family major capsid protein
MALGSRHSTSILGTTGANTGTANHFIPELWSDEVIGAYKSNLVLANLVTKMSHKGKKGDTINIPAPSRGTASAKTASTQVTISADSVSTVEIRIRQHYEYSKLIEDIAEVQALSSMRKFYTDDAGHALAKQVDTDLFNEAELLQSGSFTGDWATAKEFDTNGVLSNYLAAGTEYDISDAAIRGMLLLLDNADVPMDNRSMVIPPVAANDLLGISRFTEQQFIGSGDAIKTGKIGAIYGVDVYISTNCPTTAGGERVGLMLHKDAMVFAEQMGIRTQTQYKQEYLGDLFTADTIYGVGELRNDAGVAFVVPAA